MELVEEGLKQLRLNDHKIQNGFALVIVNKKFKYYATRNGAEADKENIMRFCAKAGLTVNDIKTLGLKGDDFQFDQDGNLKTDNLTKKEMEILFQTISKGNFESFDAFICFISSHGNQGGILGCDDEPIPVQYIVDQFIASKEKNSLVNKPKLFFTQNCRGTRTNEGAVVPVNDDDDEADSVDEADSGRIPYTIPTTADVLVAYSTVNGYECYRNKKEGSWFILKLTEILNEYASMMHLADILALVNEKVAERETQSGKKQMPCFTSTLRKAVRFKIPDVPKQESRKETKPL